MADTSGRPIAMMMTFAAILGLSSAALSQDAPKPGEVGCTTVNGVATGPGCESAAGTSTEGKVESGMPATEHQQKVLRTDDKAPQGQNMEATGAGGGAMPATEHQQDVLKQPDSGAKTSP